MARVKKDHRCKLLPYRKLECVSMLDAQQKAGWGITAFNLPDAWKYTQGEGVIIAVIDTGCDLDHPDLKDNLLDGYNIIHPERTAEDDNGHGTHVTGILVGQNNGIGMVGVCPKAKVIPIKALDKDGNGNFTKIACAIRYAVDRKADFIAMSLGCPAPLQEVRKAIQFAESSGVVTFVAAGNAGSTKEIFYPANYKETISVGAIDENFKRAEFSCTGQNLDFMAPGVDIFSTFPDDWYATLSGTSMACPFAVGVAALLLSYVRAIKSNIVLTCSEDYRQLFRKHTVDISEIDVNNSKFYEGFGIIDPMKLIQESI